jgi:iron complex outermembrane receptor protein
LPTAHTVSPPEPQSAEIMVFGRLAKDSVMTIPQSVEIIDRRLIANSGSETVGDTLRFIPGASRDGSSLDAFGDTYLIRGFEANQTINGIASSTMRQGRDTIGIERVEVLKGPASVLYGQLKPGAVVNIVTKQPKRDPEAFAGLSFGRYDDWRATADLTGPLTKGGDLRFRVTAAYDDADSFVDYWHRRHLFVAPVVALDVDHATTVTIEGVYSYNRLRGFFNGLPADGTVRPNPNGRFARALSLTDPTFAPSIRKDSEITGRIEHRFSENIRWRTAISWMHEYHDEGTVFGLLGWSDDTRRSLMRAVLASVGSGDNWTAHTDLNYGFQTGPISHEVVVGGDYTWFDRATTGSTSLTTDLDLYAPVYERSSAPATVRIPSRNTTTDERTRTAGLFAQDRIGITAALKLVAGARWSDYRQTVVSTRGARAPALQRQQQTAWTTQIGLLYMPTPTLSLFANRTTSFLPVQGITAGGSPLKPETGRQYELGAKADLLDGRLSLNGALSISGAAMSPSPTASRPASCCRSANRSQRGLNCRPPPARWRE